MTVTEPIPAGPVEAASGRYNVLDMMPDPSTTGPALSAMRNEPALSLVDTNWQTFRCCSRTRVRFMTDRCDPGYDPAVHGEKCSSTCFSSVEFEPFGFYDLQHLACLTTTLDLQTETDRQVEFDTEWAITTELDWAPSTGNPSLRTHGLDITPTNTAGQYLPVDPVQAMSMLNLTYSMAGAGHVILVTPALVPFLVDRGQIINRSGVWRTPLGSPVIVGSGFTGVAPANDRAGNPKPQAPDVNQPFTGVSTIYAMRSIPEYQTGQTQSYADVMGQAGVEVHHRTNSQSAESTRRAAVRFDPHCVYAVQTCLQLPSGCSA